MRSYLLIFFLLISNVVTILAQSKLNPDILKELKSELLTQDSSKVYLYHFIDNEPKASRYTIDSSKQIRSQQPDVNKVLSILNEILILNDTIFYVELLDLHKEYLEVFKQEWEVHYINNYYKCDFAGDLFKIPTGLEEILKSLWLKKTFSTYTEMFDFYLKEQNLNNLVISSEKDFEKLYKMKAFSRSYQDLRKINGWHATNIPFHYLDPYLENLKPFFIDLLKECTWGETEEACDLVLKSYSVILKLEDDSIASVFQQNYDNWVDNIQVVWIYKYAGLYSFYELTQFLTNRLITDERLFNGKTDPRGYYLFLLSRNLENRDVIVRTLLDSVDIEFNKGNYLPIAYLSEFYDNKDIVDKFESILVSKDITEKQGEIMKSNLMKMAYYSKKEEVVERINNILNQSK